MTRLKVRPQLSPAPKYFEEESDYCTVEFLVLIPCLHLLRAYRLAPSSALLRPEVVNLKP